MRILNILYVANGCSSPEIALSKTSEYINNILKSKLYRVEPTFEVKEANQELIEQAAALLVPFSEKFIIGDVLPYQGKGFKLLGGLLSSNSCSLDPSYFIVKEIKLLTMEEFKDV